MVSWVGNVARRVGRVERVDWVTHVVHCRGEHDEAASLLAAGSCTSSCVLNVTTFEVSLKC